MPVAISRCAGGGHVTLAITGEKGDTRSLTMDLGDLLTNETAVDFARRTNLSADDAALVLAARGAISKAGVGDFAGIKATLEDDAAFSVSTVRA